MVVDMDFLMFLIGFLGLLGGIFGIILRYSIKNTSQLVELTTSFKAFEERDRCEMQRINKRLDVHGDRLDSHESRLERLEHINKK